MDRGNDENGKIKLTFLKHRSVFKMAKSSDKNA
jgi:hypothetical protein